MEENASTSVVRRRTSLVRVQLVKEHAVDYYVGSSIGHPDELAAVTRAVLAGADREHFVVLHLNTKNKVVSLEVIAVGTLSAVLVHPREVFKGALLANANAIALAHNHPSGDPTPSEGDTQLTQRLIAAGNMLDIPVLDHIILGSDTFVSLKATTALWS